MGAYTFGNYRQRPGMMESPDRPQALEPIPEEYAGVNFPYRGTVNHGVAPTTGVDPEEYYENDQYDAGPEEIPSLPEEKEPDPIKVKVVNESARERYTFRTYTYPANGQTAKALCGRNDKRMNVRVRVPASATNGVYLGPSGSGLDPVTGYLIEPGQSDILRTTEEVYVLADTGADTNITVYVCEEIAVEL